VWTCGAAIHRIVWRSELTADPTQVENVSPDPYVAVSIHSLFQIQFTMGCCPSKLCKSKTSQSGRTNSSSDSERYTLWKFLKPEDVGDYFLIPLKCLFVGLIYLLTIVIILPLWVLSCLGFGKCWGKRFLRKMTRKYGVRTSDLEKGGEHDDVMKDGFVVVEKQE